ncbi:hypothetical protein ARMSODRAFT_1047000 [Armillaria solidipes]|uniref:Uncharacterized protein n=1 Tax=Armillaria solidipes TaxID=1076256 RepID=A0A2H3BI23_9AGAR|nr:hypothetical protein ARMSODRAFT_1047000 [Armillaria solidipes]
MFTPGMDSNGTWTGGDVHGFDWDITGTLLTDDDDIKRLTYATFNVLSSMPPFDRAEAHQAIEPLSSHFKSQAPELLRIQTSWTEFDMNSTDIVNNDLVLPSGEGDRFGYRGGDAQMPDRQSSFYSREFQCGDNLIPGTQCSSVPEARTNGFDGRGFSPRVNSIHAGNEGIFNLSKAASLFLDESYGTEETPSNPLTLISERLLHYPLARKGPLPTSRTHGPAPIGPSSSFFQEQLIERFPRARTSQKTSNTLSDSVTNPEGTLSSTSPSRSSDDDFASVASSSVSVSSEFSVDILPCPEGFHRAEFDPRHQELLAQNLNLPVDKVFYYEHLQDETTHKCPLGCGTEFPGYTIREHMKKFHKGMCNGPQVQCDRSLLLEGSDIQCSGEKMSAQSFAHHFEDVHCRRSALCVTCPGTSSDAVPYIPNVLLGGHSLWYADLHQKLHLRNVVKCLKEIIDAIMLA